MVRGLGVGALILLAVAVTITFISSRGTAEATITGEPADCVGHVRLTFDDGPHPEFTPRILDALEQSGATATFFAEGRLVEENPDVAARVVTDGHELENHTWDHPYLTSLSTEEVRTQLTRTATVIEEATGMAPTQWRPPYEDYTPEIQQIATSLGMEMVLWDYETDTNDWRGAGPEDIRDVVLDNATDGSIILMHDRIENTATAVPMILDGLHQKGLCTQ